MKKTSAKPRKQKGSLRIADSASRIAKAIKEESTKARAVTPRQRTVLANLRKGMSQYKAIRGAGYSEATARHPGELLRGKALGLAFEKLMPSIEELASGIRAGTLAKKTQFATFEGQVTDAVDCIDYAERREYIKLAAGFKGLVIQKVEVTAPEAMTMNVRMIGRK